MSSLVRFGKCSLALAQVNPHVPICRGDAEIHVSNIDILHDGAMPLHELGARKVTPAEQKIAEYIASELVSDNATLQTGSLFLQIK